MSQSLFGEWISREPHFNLVLEKAVRAVEIKTTLLTTKGPNLLLAYADDIDLIVYVKVFSTRSKKRLEKWDEESTNKKPNTCV